MPFHDINIARESVQVKEKTGKAVQATSPVCLPRGATGCSGNGMPASRDVDSSRLPSFPSPVDSSWQVLHHGHGIVPGRL
ncbi:MAG: hypothetical protein OXD45_06560 [Rhodobacteraceae bacterium]|nr:hypothetical protein [Paracoccaceae bacterium]